jgi:hypothetical protein
MKNVVGLLLRSVRSLGRTCECNLSEEGDSCPEPFGWQSTTVEEL